MEISNGRVKLNETTEKRMIDLHLDRGFAIVTGFRSELRLSEGRRRNREIALFLKRCGLGHIKVTGGYVETIDKDSPEWEKGTPIEDDEEHRKLAVFEESLLVPFFDIIGKERVDDEHFSDFEDLMVQIGMEYGQESVLISPPAGMGKPHYVATKDGSGEEIGDVTCEFQDMSLASIADTYFTMKEKTISKADRRRKVGNGGFKFESRSRNQRVFVESYVDAPAFTIGGVRGREYLGEIPLFHSHYMGLSSLRKD